MGVYYDLFRILRRVFHFSYVMILGQDLLFWLTGAVGVFFSSVVVYEGQLRILFVLASLAGWGIYAATAGSLLMSVVDVALAVLRRLSGFVFRHTFMPLIKRIRTLWARISGIISTRKEMLFAPFRKKREKNAENKENTA